MFDNLKENDTLISDLVAGICRLAGSLDDRTPPEEADQAFQETVTLAYKLEEHLNICHERIKYLDKLSMTDSLTGVLNRRGFLVEIQRVLSSAKRFEETGVLAYVDLDDFKEINDNFGHASGDQVLCHVASVLENMTRSIDYVARLGGDEFAILLIRTSWHDGQRTIEKISNELNQTTLQLQNNYVDLKASIGLQFYDKSSLVHELMDDADKSMYALKKLRHHQKMRECTIKAAE